MPWIKRGLIFCPNRQNSWMVSHAQLPTPLLLPDCIRVFIMTRDAENRSRVGVVDLDRENPSRILRVHDRAALDLGVRGGFDDNGVAPSCAISVDEELWLYYVGVSPRVTVALSYAIGLAISRDDGLTFERAYPGPILDRTAREPFLFTSPQVVRGKNIWHMYYTSGTGWATIRDRPEMLYEIKYAKSLDGRCWERKNQTCVEPSEPLQVTARPWVIRDADVFRMWFCFRGSRDFRDGADSYRIGYAESPDGVTWTRADEMAGIALSDSGWDSTMMAYPAVLDVDDKRFMFYNGNGFGKSGFGFAEWR